MQNINLWHVISALQWTPVSDPRVKNKYICIIKYKATLQDKKSQITRNKFAF